MSRQQSHVHLGYAVGSGEAVSVPIAHMAVVGITQQSGKTTTLESLAHRAGRQVLAFVTKRGEGSFGAAPGHSVRSIPPYFRERADWQFVEAVLEATMRERMKYDRQWIMKVSRGATTLRDVRANTVKALDAARGEFMKGVYEKLLAYLDIVVPQLGAITWAPKISLDPCLNVMDLSALSSEVQGLVIASCLDFVMAQLKDTIVIVPEAWEFIPRGRKSPVTLSAEAYVRKGAALKNFLWIDSQDLSGVHTPILKQTTVWLLGVQREINEVKRTLATVPSIPHKLKPEAITTLGLGQFYAVYAGVADKTYVQPWWMTETAAREAAMGSTQHAVQEAAKHYTPTSRISNFHAPGEAPTWRPLPPMPVTSIITDIEDPMDAELRRENERLKQQVADLTAKLAKIPVSELRDWGAADAEDQAAALARESVHPGPSSSIPLPGLQPTLDQFYDYFLSRLKTDERGQALLLKVQTSRPEIVVEIVPRVVAIDGSSARGRLAKLMADGFFDGGKRQGEARTQMGKTGSEVNGGTISTLFSEFVRDGLLVRHGSDRYIMAPGLKVTTKTITAV